MRKKIIERHIDERRRPWRLAATFTAGIALSFVFGCAKPPEPGSLRQAAESLTLDLNQRALDELPSKGEPIVLKERTTRPADPCKLKKGDRVEIRNLIDVSQEKIEYRLDQVGEPVEVEDSERFSYSGSILVTKLRFTRSLDLAGEPFITDVPIAWPLIDNDKRGRKYKELLVNEWLSFPESPESVKRRALDKLNLEAWNQTSAEEKQITLYFDKERRLWCDGDEPIPILTPSGPQPSATDAPAVHLHYHDGKKMSSEQILVKDQTDKGLERRTDGWYFKRYDFLNSDRVFSGRMKDAKGNDYQRVRLGAAFKDGVLIRHSGGLEYLNKKDFTKQSRRRLDDFYKSLGKEVIRDDEVLKTLKIYLDNKKRLKTIKKPSDEKIVEEIRREAKRLVELRYNEAEKRRILKRFDEHEKPIEVGDEIEVTYRYGAKWRKYKGTFRGANTQKVVVGDKEIPIFDLSSDISSRLNKTKNEIRSLRSVYLTKNFHIPKAKFYREMLAKVKKDVCEKYGCDPNLLDDKTILHK